MFDTASKAFFHLLAGSPPLKAFASRYGMRRPASFARRFIAGETTAEAIDAAKTVEARGMTITLDHLGESLTSLSQADDATREYIEIIDAVVAADIGRNISLKLTQLGLDVDRACCVDNLRRVLDKAEANGFFIRVDMEGSAYTAVTLDIFETMWGLGYRDVGVVLQAALHRTEGDLARMMRLGARVRLVKGAYEEPKAIAYHKKHDVDEAYTRLMKTLLVEGNYPAFATHDPEMHTRVLRWAAERSIGRDKYEFQLLYGIRRDLQQSLLSSGSNVRIYIPFGREWFPYFMRRLGERPANVRSVVASILDERAARRN
jgi:proline dehydrogenase